MCTSPSAGTAGEPWREVRVTAGDTIEIRMEAPPSGPEPAPFALYVWLGRPDPASDSPQPFGLGTTCFPTYLVSGLPKPFRVWNNLGHPGWLGEPNYPSQPAPSTIVSRATGWPQPVTITIQGFIADNGSAAEGPGSVTNGVVLRVTP